MSLKNRIIRFARNNPSSWVPGGEYERMAMGIGKKGSNAGRRCRELVIAGILDRREVNGFVEYRYHQTVHTIINEEKPKVIKQLSIV